MRQPVPPFSYDDAVKKVRMAEDAWNTRDPEKVALAYTPDTRWRNRSEFLNGRDAVRTFLTRKWATESGYRLIKEIWAYAGNRIAVRFCYEYHDANGQWYRAQYNVAMVELLPCALWIRSRARNGSTSREPPRKISRDQAKS